MTCSSQMKKLNQHFLIVGLGNPTEKYEMTRHNLGFMLVKRFAAKHEFFFKNVRTLRGKVAHKDQGEEEVVLLLPTTYMNLSGESVKRACHFFHVKPSHLLVVVDDVYLPFGSLRSRREGSSGGHNGLKSVESSLSTREYARLRVGIGPSNSESLEMFVLSPFSEKEQEQLPHILKRGVGMLEKWLAENEGTYEKAISL